MAYYGIFSLYNLSTKEKDTLADFLQHSINTPMIELLRYYMGDDFLQFIDVMSGTTIKIPSSSSIAKDISSVQVYLYAKRHNFSENYLCSASKLYKKSLVLVKKDVYRVGKALGVEDTLKDEALENYLNNIKSFGLEEEARIKEINESRRANIERSFPEIEKAVKNMDESLLEVEDRKDNLE